MWHVQRDDGDETGNTGLVLVAADYELLTDLEAYRLARAIIEVLERRAYYVGQNGGRYATQAEYESQP